MSYMMFVLGFISCLICLSALIFLSRKSAPKDPDPNIEEARAKAAYGSFMSRGG